MEKFLTLISLLFISCEEQIVKEEVYLEEPIPIVDSLATVLITDITDGDTYKFSWKNETWTVRVLYIDCFETRNGSTLEEQAEKFNISLDSAKTLGLKGKHFAEDNLLGQEVEIIRDYSEPNFDNFGRLLRSVYLNKINVIELLGERGLIADTIN